MKSANLILIIEKTNRKNIKIKLMINVIGLGYIGLPTAPHDGFSWG